MRPLHPPLPAASSFPFHPAAGIQTSILISESEDGLIVAMMRQNAGSVANTAAADDGGVDAGSVKWPASTDSAVVIVVFVSFRFLSASHDPAPAAAWNASTEAMAVAINPPVSRFMGRRICDLY